jgi:DNA polymerase-3 subunit epsilon
MAGVVLGSFSTMIKLPEGMEVPERAAAVHGISAETANLYGVSKEEALTQFKHLLDRADMVVAHNKDFDLTMVSAEAHRAAPDLTFDGKQQFCTMAAASPVINLPPTPKMQAAGFNKPKPPRLEECIQHFFGETLEGAHDAMIDVQACQRVYFHLKSMETQDA